MRAFLRLCVIPRCTVELQGLLVSEWCDTCVVFALVDCSASRAQNGCAKLALNEFFFFSFFCPLFSLPLALSLSFLLTCPSRDIHSFIHSHLCLSLTHSATAKPDQSTSQPEAMFDWQTFQQSFLQEAQAMSGKLESGEIAPLPGTSVEFLVAGEP